MIRRTPDYGVEAANQKDRLISGAIVTGAAALTALSVVAFLHADGEPSVPPLSLEKQQEQMTTAIETVARDGGEPFSIDPRVSCDFSLLVGDLVVQRTLSDEDSYASVIVMDRVTGDVPEFGRIDCFEDENGIRIVRGNNGW